MPYELRGKCVHKKGDAKPIKCHPSKQQAQAHLAALNANVMDANIRRTAGR